MLDQLISLAQQQLTEQFTSDPDVDNGIVPQAAQAASSSIVNQIMEQVKGGNLGAITEMLSGGQTDASHPEVNSLMPNISNQLMSQLGIGEGLAQQLAGKAIPIVMNLLNSHVGKAKEGGMDISSLLGQLTGGGSQQGGSGLLGNLVGGLLGGNQGGGGIASLIGKLLGGNR